MLRQVALVYVLSALVSSLHCPENCTCSIADEYEYECNVEGEGVALTAQMNRFVNFRCYNANVTCEQIPNVNLTIGRQLQDLTLRGCPPELLGCVMRAVNAKSIEVLNFREPSKELQAKDLQDEDLQMLSLRKLLFYDAPQVHSIPTDVLLALSTLPELRINNANLILTPDEFRGVNSIQYLELSADNIEKIPPGAFRGLSKLKQLQLWKNRIHEVTRESFEGLESLEELSLMGNLLKKLPVGVFEEIPKLRVLYLDENSLQRLTAGTFTGRHLEDIIISSNSVPLNLENGTFGNLPALRTLLLNYSQITSLPGDLFLNSTNITMLVLNHNQIEQLPDDLFQGLKALEKLDLSFNRISNLKSNVFIPLKALVELNMDRNYLQVLPDNLFAGLSNFRILRMDHNHLHTISQFTFHGAGSLQTISMIGNSLSFKSTVMSYANPYVLSPFRMVTGLRELILQGNKVEVICSDWSVSMTQLEKLDLSWNNFTTLADGELQFLSNKLTVDLRHNKISKISLQDLHRPQRKPQDSGTQVTILLEDNPIQCDCQFYGLSLALEGWKPLTVFPSFDLGAATCASPPDKRGYLVKTITPTQITCGLDTHDCPTHCNCQIRPHANLMELDCQYFPKTWPNVRNSGANSIKLRLHNATGITTLPRSVQDIDLRNLSLSRVPFNVTHLTKLDLRNNLMEEIPINVLNTNTSLSLSGNPFDCSCWYKNEITLFLNSYNVDDLDNVTCSDGRKITDLDVLVLCTVRDASILASTLFVILIIIALLIAASITKYKQGILVYITHKGYLRWLIDVELLDKDKIYDVFVSFSHQDEMFVIKSLIPKLENDFKLNVCVHYRDWIIGDMIPIQIHRSVEQSRKTLIVLSRSFLSSIWATMEFRTAHSMALREGIARVVLIVYDDDVLTDSMIDEDLQAYLSTNTYLKLDDPKFWERLKKALPPRERKFTFLRKWRQGERAAAPEKTAKGGLDGQLRNGQLVNAALQKDMV